MAVKTIVGFSKDDRFSQDQFLRFYELASDAGFNVVSSLHIPAISKIPKEEESIDEDTILAVFGGDGTMLRALKHYVGIETIGINCGSFGFLCEFEAPDLEEAINFLLQKQEWVVEKTNIIESLYGEKSFLGINDCVVSGADTGRPVDLRLLVEGITMFDTRGDGLLISTPNGSTAYNIAAGGSIISPSISAIAITPIAPFLTLDRSVILDDSKTIQVVNLERTRRCIVFYDGEAKHELGPGEKFALKSSDKKSVFLRRQGSFSRRMALKIANRYPIR